MMDTDVLRGIFTTTEIDSMTLNPQLCEPGTSSVEKCGWLMHYRMIVALINDEKLEDGSPRFINMENIQKELAKSEIRRIFPGLELEGTPDIIDRLGPDMWEVTISSTRAENGLKHKLEKFSSTGGKEVNIVAFDFNTGVAWAGKDPSLTFANWEIALQVLSDTVNSVALSSSPDLLNRFGETMSKIELSDKFMEFIDQTFEKITAKVPVETCPEVSIEEYLMECMSVKGIKGNEEAPMAKKFVEVESLPLFGARESMMKVEGEEGGTKEGDIDLIKGIEESNRKLQKWKMPWDGQEKLFEFPEGTGMQDMTKSLMKRLESFDFGKSHSITTKDFKGEVYKYVCALEEVSGQNQFVKAEKGHIEITKSSPGLMSVLGVGRKEEEGVSRAQLKRDMKGRTLKMTKEERKVAYLQKKEIYYYNENFDDVFDNLLKNPAEKIDGLIKIVNLPKVKPFFDNKIEARDELNDLVDEEIRQLLDRQMSTLYTEFSCSLGSFPLDVSDSHKESIKVHCVRCRVRVDRGMEEETILVTPGLYIRGKDHTISNRGFINGFFISFSDEKIIPMKGNEIVFWYEDGGSVRFSHLTGNKEEFFGFQQGRKAYIQGTSRLSEEYRNARASEGAFPLDISIKDRVKVILSNDTLMLRCKLTLARSFMDMWQSNNEHEGFCQNLNRFLVWECGIMNGRNVLSKDPTESYTKCNECLEYCTNPITSWTARGANAAFDGLNDELVRIGKIRDDARMKFKGLQIECLGSCYHRGKVFPVVSSIIGVKPILVKSKVLKPSDFGGTIDD